MWAPRVDDGEALHRETRYFLDCVASGEQPVNDGRAGLRVVRMLEAADDSLRRRRESVYAGARIGGLLPRPGSAPLQGAAGGVPVASASH
jgi:hypothetical protein